MPSYIVFSVLAIAVVAVWGAGLLYLDLFTPEDVKAWRKLAALRGFAAPRSPIAKFAERAGFLQRLQSELDLSRLLAIANRSDTPLSFLARSTMIGMVITALAIFLDIVYRLVVGDWLLGIAPVVLIAVFFITLLVLLLDLRQDVGRRQSEADRALGDMMMLVAIMTEGRGLQVEDSVRILARCVETSALQDIVDQRGFLRLVKQHYGSTIELYRMIQQEYGIGMFGMVADAAANANVGFAERDTYTRVAKSVYQQRLAEAKMKAARAKILVTIPVAGMLIPLLVLLGAPTFASLANSLK